MSHIKGNISRNTGATTGSVGKTYGERKVGTSTLRPSPAGSAIPPSQRFRKDGNQKTAQAQKFFGNRANFKKGLSRFMGAGGVPHKPRPLHNMENGSAAKSAQKEALPPSDAALDKFLSKIIDTPHLHSQRAARRAFARGAPIKK